MTEEDKKTHKEAKEEHALQTHEGHQHSHEHSHEHKEEAEHEHKEKIDEKKQEKKSAHEKKKKTEAMVTAENIPISTKHSAAICKFIKGKKIEVAIADLGKVL